jgi:hypothetical protein
MRWPAVQAIVLSGMTLACASPPPVQLFDCRVSVEPLLAKLRAGGGEASRVLHPRTAKDLGVVEAGKRYRFVVLPDGRLAIAPLPDEAPANEYVHPVLAAGVPVRTAGGIRVERDGKVLAKVTVDQDSDAYCPTESSLAAALTELARLGVPPERLRVDNRPPVCVGAAPPPEAPARYGALMAEVGLRFERLGRAARSHRLALADFELGEIQEVFEEDLPHAEPPRESKGVELGGVAQSFQETNLPELKAALDAKDMTAFGKAYAHAAETCNGCHRASGHAFVEIPQEPGLPVPRLDPAP